MAIATREWIDLIEGEYLRDFVTNGGAGVKFAVGDADQLAAVGGMLAGLSDRHRAGVCVDRCRDNQAEYDPRRFLCHRPCP